MESRSPRQLGALAWPGIFWVLAFLAPLSAVLFRAIDASGTLKAVLGSAYYRSVFGVTVKQASLSTLFSVLIGLPGAGLVAVYRFPGRRLLKSLTTVPFVLPSILAVLGFILVFGNSGLVNNIRRAFLGAGTAPWKILYSLKAVVMAHVFYNFPLTLRIVGDAWAGLSRNPHRAARALGAGPGRSLFLVDVPRLIPSILTAGLLTFIYCFMSFTIILILGGGPALSTLEVEVYRLIKYGLNFSEGSALAMVETVFILTLMGVYVQVISWGSRWLKDEVNSPAPVIPRKLTGLRAAGALLYLIPSLILILAPLAAIIVSSFLGRTTRGGELAFTFGNWLKVLGFESSAGFGPPVALGAVGRTLGLGIAAAVLTTVTAGLSAWVSASPERRFGRIADILTSTPMAVSSVILGLGYLILAHKVPGDSIIRTAGVVMVHTVIALPFAHRIISNRLRSISPRIRQAARALGAGPIKTFVLVELPLARRALVTSAVFSMALSAGEMNATIILAPTGFTTMPLAIYRMIGAYDLYGACALGSILIVVSAVAFLVLDRFAEEAL